MEIKTRLEQGIMLLDLDGKITMGEEDFAIRNTVLRALKEGHKRFLINLGGVTTIDSSGVGELVSTRNEVVKQGGQVVFFNPSKRVGGILKLTKLDTVLKIVATEMEARLSIK